MQFEDAPLWTNEVDVSGERPPAGAHHSTVLVGDRVYAFGGMGEFGMASQDIHVLDVDMMEWEKLDITVPAPVLAGNNCAGVGMVVALFCGDENGTAFDKVHLFNVLTQEFEEHATSGDTPDPRRGHTLDVVGDTVYLFGGRSGKKKHSNSLHSLNTTTWEWKAVQTKGKKPKGRGFHASTVVGRKLYICFGRQDKSDSNDVFVLDTSKSKWTRIDARGNPPVPRHHLSVSSANNKLILFGGMTKAYRGDCCVLDLSNAMWFTPNDKLSDPPSARAGHTMLRVDNRILVFAGECGQGEFLTDVSVMDADRLTMGSSAGATAMALDQNMLDAPRPAAERRVENAKATGKVKAINLNKLVEEKKRWEDKFSAFQQALEEKTYGVGADSKSRAAFDAELETMTWEQVEMLYEKFDSRVKTLEREQVDRRVELERLRNDVADLRLESATNAVSDELETRVAEVKAKYESEETERLNEIAALKKKLADAKEARQNVRTKEALETQIGILRGNIARTEARQRCYVCKKRDVDCAVLPCAHWAFCHTCLSKHFATNSTCPLCKAPASGVMRSEDKM